jgi:hypothetical protein
MLFIRCAMTHRESHESKHLQNCRFVNMALPRSVKELSKLDFLPRHCESDKFRGFSFIGDGFPLPERSVSFYFLWYNVAGYRASSHCMASHTTTLNFFLALRLPSRSITGKTSTTTVRAYRNARRRALMMISAASSAMPPLPNQLPTRRSDLRARRRKTNNPCHLSKRPKRATNLHL